MKKYHYSGGMTLVEILVSLVCMSVVMTAMYQVFFNQNRITSAEQQILEMQMNGRVAMERLRFIFSNAGFGCKDSLNNGKSLSGTEPGGSALVVNSVFADFQDVNPSVTTNSSDSVIVSYGYRDIATVDGSQNATTAIPFTAVDTDPDLQTSGFKSYVTFFPDANGDVFYQVDTINSYVRTLDSTVGPLMDGVDVFMVVPVRIYVSDNKLYFKNFAYTSSNLWEVADNIENLQLEFFDGNREVGIYLLSRTSRPDPEYLDTKVYQLGTSTVGPFNDHIHRKVSEARVMVRSMQ